MLRRLGYPSVITSEPEVIGQASKLILPGVGAFDNGMTKLRAQNLEPVLRTKALEEKVPVLGICLGMQLLGKGSEEGSQPGLGWINGRCVRFSFDEQNHALKVPHMGWNEVHVEKDSRLLAGANGLLRFYFVHSYHMVCESVGDIMLSVDYGGKITAAVECGNIMGTQFHPEKSHKFGMLILKNFAEL